MSLVPKGKPCPANEPRGAPRWPRSDCAARRRKPPGHAENSLSREKRHGLAETDASRVAPSFLVGYSFLVVSSLGLQVEPLVAECTAAACALVLLACMPSCYLPCVCWHAVWCSCGTCLGCALVQLALHVLLRYLLCMCFGATCSACALVHLALHVLCARLGW